MIHTQRNQLQGETITIVNEVTGNNVGTGQPVYRDKTEGSPDVLNFRTLKAGNTNITIAVSEDGNEIILSGVNGDLFNLVELVKPDGTHQYFASPDLARTAAVTGSTIIVYPGTYNNQPALNKNDNTALYYFFHPGAKMNFAGKILDMILVGATAFIDKIFVWGKGDFTGAGLKKVSGVGSLYFEYESLSCSDNIEISGNNAFIKGKKTAFTSNASKLLLDSNISNEFSFGLVTRAAGGNTAILQARNPQGLLIKDTFISVQAAVTLDTPVYGGNESISFENCTFDITQFLIGHENYPGTIDYVFKSCLIKTSLATFSINLYNSIVSASALYWTIQLTGATRIICDDNFCSYRVMAIPGNVTFSLIKDASVQTSKPFNPDHFSEVAELPFISYNPYDVMRVRGANGMEMVLQMINAQSGQSKTSVLKFAVTDTEVTIGLDGFETVLDLATKQARDRFTYTDETDPQNPQVVTLQSAIRQLN